MARLQRAQMDAVVLPRFGAPDVLATSRTPVPRPGPDDVLVRVGAVAVGRTLDVAVRAGRPPFASQVRLPHILGADHVGEVVEAGARVRPPQSDRVAVFPVIHCGRCRACRQDATEQCRHLELIGVHRQGAYAEFCAVPARAVHPVPPQISDRDACAVALNGAVAQRQLDEAGAGPDDWVLVTGAAGALGSAVVATASHRGIRVVAATRDPDKRERLEALGADLVVDLRHERTRSLVMTATSAHGVASIIDNVAEATTWDSMMDLLAVGGRVVCSGVMGHARVSLDLRSMYLRSQSITTVRTARPRDSVAAWRAVESGLRLPVDPIELPLARAAEAHRHLEGGRTFGRVVLDVAGR